MLFARRVPLTWHQRFLHGIWPRQGVDRSARYLRLRLARHSGSPHRVALGLAVGIFVASLPIVGAQFVAAIALAWMLRGSVPAALLGTFWANPLTIPVVWLSAYGLGCYVLGIAPLPAEGAISGGFDHLRSALLAPGFASAQAACRILWPVLKPTLVGAIPIGLVTAAVFYVLCRMLVSAYRMDANNTARSHGFRFAASLPRFADEAR